MSDRRGILILIVLCALSIGCTQQTLLVVDPYIVDLFPDTFSQRAITLQQFRHRQSIDILVLPPGSALPELLPPLLDSEEYTAVITTPLHSPNITIFAEMHAAIPFWAFAIPAFRNEQLPPNLHSITFQNEVAMEQIAEYLATEYTEFDDEFLFLFNPRSDQDYRTSAHLEEALLAQGLKFEIQRLNPVNEEEVISYIEKINSGQYNVVGLFLKRHNELLLNNIENENTKIIAEHIGDETEYNHLSSIIASIEYDYETGLAEALSAIRNTTDQNQEQHINVDTTLTFYNNN